jgi:hypothetical protein
MSTLLEASGAMGGRGGRTHHAPDVLDVAPAATRLGGVESDGAVEVEPAADKVNDLQPEGGARLEHVDLDGAETDSAARRRTLAAW